MEGPHVLTHKMVLVQYFNKFKFSFEVDMSDLGQNQEIWLYWL